MSVQKVGSSKVGSSKGVLYLRTSVYRLYCQDRTAAWPSAPVYRAEQCLPLFGCYTCVLRVIHMCTVLRVYSIVRNAPCTMHTMHTMHPIHPIHPLHTIHPIQIPTCVWESIWFKVNNFSDLDANAQSAGTALVLSAQKMGPRFPIPCRERIQRTYCTLFGDTFPPPFPRIAPPPPP
jgi:hypothetical protein